jgi:hypothetical protein
MNRLDFGQTGGHPLTLDDFSFIQDAWRDSFKAAVNLLRDPALTTLLPSFIIAGCEKTNPSAGVWSIAEGYMVYEGEICYVPAHTLSYSNINDPLYWYIDQTAVAPSPVEYKDFSIKNIHLRRQAKVRTTSSTVAYSTKENVRAMLDRRQRGDIGTINGANGWTGGITYVKAHGRVSLYGILSTTSNTTHGNVMFQLPAELTPYCHGFGYLGTAPAVDSLIAGILALQLAQSGLLPYMALRVYLNGSTPTSYTPWPLTIQPLNLTSPPPRVANLRVLNPVNIPPGSDSVLYNFNGISWDIAAE